MVLLPCFYFAPISYYNVWGLHKDKAIERWENFPKQTYRNRCIIQGANGKLPLIIPIEHSGARIIKDIKISYSSAWQKIHWKSLQSSYQSSPYFEYYEDSLSKIFEKKETFLFDLNLSTLEWACKILDLDNNFIYTQEYIQKSEIMDFRISFNAKKNDEYKNPYYIQVFSDRFEFMNNLSILDLVFNVGPKSANYIKTF
ncbi:hypothetical protein ETU10_07910 [Apibacter muscae]|uniref:WbqC family protein n=1 Tax=Apibacter muscae TaxID=2509004 RepID=UPI0011AD4CFC|nr:WbqC family protein [Apibacter muscae]TWP23268.1 hypothetical protein ETU10_07910 [Apibacter muscae]